MGRPHRTRRLRVALHPQRTRLIPLRCLALHGIALHVQTVTDMYPKLHPFLGEFKHFALLRVNM